MKEFIKKLLYFCCLLSTIAYSDELPDNLSSNSPESIPEYNLDTNVVARINTLINANIDTTGTDTDKFRSAVVGVVNGSEFALLFYGEDQNGRLPNKISVYPLSSLTKMLTGIILAKGVVAEDFSRNTQIETLLSSDLNSDIPGVTLGMIVSHYSGLENLPPNRTGPLESPYADYSRSNLKTCLSSICSYAYPVGSTFHYSNLGIGLLGVALTDFYGHSSYEDLFSEKIGKALELKSTHVNESSNISTILSNIVIGRKSDGTLVNPAEMGVLAGAGALLSSGDDMLKILKVLTAPNNTWSLAMAEAQTVIKPISGNRSICYALERYLNHSNTVYAKGGGQSGYSSYIAWVPDLKAGAFILSDQGGITNTLLQPSVDNIIEIIQADNP
jgi:CubicO group peptidase (beta-lactamase class C family)